MASFKKMIVNDTDYDVDDPNDVETEGGELADTVINYDSATTPTIGSFTQFLDRFTSGTKVGAWFKNFRAGCEFLLHIGSLVNNCVSDNEALPLAASQGKVLMDLITQANVDIDDLDLISATAYDGRDVTEIFADEIAQYSDEWAWIKARINAGNFSGLHNGDYIPLTVNGERHEMQMNIDTYYKMGSSALGHHIDFISRDCYSQTVQWNTTDTNNGTADNSSPWITSNIYDFLNNTLLPLLPDSVRSVISGKSMMLENRYSSSDTLTDSNGWDNRGLGSLWVPMEFEVIGAGVWSSVPYGQGYCVQYPIFANNIKNRKKKAGPNGDYCQWWLANVRSGNSTSACYVGAGGFLSSAVASTEYRVPLCFRIVAS